MQRKCALHRFNPSVSKIKVSKKSSVVKSMRFNKINSRCQIDLDVLNQQDKGFMYNSLLQGY